VQYNFKQRSGKVSDENENKGSIISILTDSVTEAYKIGKMPLALITLGSIFVIFLFILGGLESLNINTAVSSVLIKNYFLYFYIAGIILIMLGLLIYLIHSFWKRKVLDRAIDSYYDILIDFIKDYNKAGNTDAKALESFLLSLSKMSILFFAKDITGALDYSIKMAMNLQ
jgi:hypothetical protein